MKPLKPKDLAEKVRAAYQRLELAGETDCADAVAQMYREYRELKRQERARDNRAMMRTCREMANALDKILDIAENAWQDPGLFEEERNDG